MEDPDNWTGCMGAIPQANEAASIGTIAYGTAPFLSSNVSIDTLQLDPSGVLSIDTEETLTVQRANLNGRLRGPGRRAGNSCRWTWTR